MSEVDLVQLLGNPYSQWGENNEVVNLHSQTTELIKRAERYLTILSYGINNKEIVDVIIEQKHKHPNLKVDIYVDAEQQARRGEGLIKKMQRHGIQVSYYLDRGSSLHMKLLLIDKTWAVFSSANLTYRGEEKNIEMGIVLKGPTVKFACQAVETLIAGLTNDGKIHSY